MLTTANSTCPQVPGSVIIENWLMEESSALFLNAVLRGRHLPVAAKRYGQRPNANTADSAVVNDKDFVFRTSIGDLQKLMCIV
jgi:hypothetical protein